MQQRGETHTHVGIPVYPEIDGRSESRDEIQSDYNSKPVPKIREEFEEWISGYHPNGHSAGELEAWKSFLIKNSRTCAALFRVNNAPYDPTQGPIHNTQYHKKFNISDLFTNINKLRYIIENFNPFRIAIVEMHISLHRILEYSESQIPRLGLISNRLQSSAAHLSKEVLKDMTLDLCESSLSILLFERSYTKENFQKLKAGAYGIKGCSNDFVIKNHKKAEFKCVFHNLDNILSLLSKIPYNDKNIVSLEEFIMKLTPYKDGALQHLKIMSQSELEYLIKVSNLLKTNLETLLIDSLQCDVIFHFPKVVHTLLTMEVQGKFKGLEPMQFAQYLSEPDYIQPLCTSVYGIHIVEKMVKGTNLDVNDIIKMKHGSLKLLQDSLEAESRQAIII